MTYYIRVGLSQSRVNRDTLRVKLYTDKDLPGPWHPLILFYYPSLALIWASLFSNDDGQGGGDLMAEYMVARYFF